MNILPRNRTDAWLATGILLFPSELTKVDQQSVLDQSQARPPAK
jgi:hypothetical protein